MSRSEFTYIEECNTSKESYEENAFTIDQVILESARILLNDSDKREDINWDTYVDECITPDEDAFTIDQVALENARIMLDDGDNSDKMDDIN